VVIRKESEELKISVFQNKTHQEIQIFPPAEQHFAWFKYEKEHPFKLHVLKTALWHDEN